MKHTPGPWEILDQRPGRVVIKSHNKKADVSGFGRTVAVVKGHWDPSSYDTDDMPKYKVTEEQMADARFIAKAPEMYEALRGWMDFHDEHLVDEWWASDPRQAPESRTMEGMQMYDLAQRSRALLEEQGE